MAVTGIGTDLVDVERFRRTLGRTPSIVARLFTDGEQAYALGARDPAPRLAARFAAKEATMKALGVGLGEVRFVEIEVVRADSGAPSLRLHGSARDLAVRTGIVDWLISLTHTDLAAHAVVMGVSGG